MNATPSERLRNAWSTALEDSRGVSVWQPPRIVPRLTSDRRLDPLVYGYRYDPEFKQCRRRGVRRHGELIEEIAAKSLRLITDRPGRGLKRAVKRFLRSLWVHFDVLHDTWLDVDGPYGHLTLAERQASFYALWKDRQNGDELPWSSERSGDLAACDHSPRSLLESSGSSKFIGVVPSASANFPMLSIETFRSPRSTELT